MEAIDKYNTEVGIFLREHGLGQYTSALAQHGYEDVEDLLELIHNDDTNDLLKEIIPLPGHRSKFSRCVLAANTTILQQQTSPQLQPRSPPRAVQPIHEATDVLRQSSNSNRNSRLVPCLVDDASLHCGATAAVGGINKEEGDPNTTTFQSVREFTPDKSPGHHHHHHHRHRGTNNRSHVSPDIASEVREGSVGPSVSSSFALPQVNFKVVVVGRGGCGKSSVISRLVKNEFSSNFRSTLGVEFSEKKFRVGGRVVALQMWDIWGQENCSVMTRSYYTGAKGALVVYDVTNVESLLKALEWKKDLDTKIKHHANGQSIPVLLVGNKSDLLDVSFSKAFESESSDLKNKDTLNKVLFPPISTRESTATSNSGAIDPPGPKTSTTTNESSSSPNSILTEMSLLSTPADVRQFISTHSFAGHFFVSAKTGDSIRQLAEQMIQAILRVDPAAVSSSEVARNIVSLDSSPIIRGKLKAVSDDKKKGKRRC